MSYPNNPLWNLAVFDQYGEIVCHAQHAPNSGPPTFTGDMVALAEAMPSVKALDRFFVDPDEQAKHCYEAYCDAFEETYGSTHPTWDELKAMPHKSSTVEIWRKTAAAAARIDHNLN